MTTTISTSAPGTVSSGTINSLPDWYTNYAKNITTLGSGLAANLPGYSGYVDANGNSLPLTAGLNGTEQQGINNAKSNVGSYAPGMAAAGSTLNNGVNTVQGATANFNGATDAYNASLGTVGSGLSQINNASGALNNMGNSLGQASSYLAPAQQLAQNGANGSEFSTDAMSKYMNPYTDGVVSNLTRLSNQNLTENILPAVNSTFTGAGQFGSTRNADFENRAIRDNQTALNGQIAQTLSDAQNQALTQANNAANRDVAASGQVSNLSGLATNIASGYGSQATGQINQGNATINGAGAQQAAGAGLNSVGNSMVNQGSALGTLSNSQATQAQATHDMGNQDTQALLGAGLLQQQTDQSGLTNAYNEYKDQRDYPLTALSGLSSVLSGVSSKVNPNTETTTVNATQATSPYQSISDLLSGLAYMN